MDAHLVVGELGDAAHVTLVSAEGLAEEGINDCQARSQVVTVWGYLTPMSDSEKSVRA